MDALHVRGEKRLYMGGRGVREGRRCEQRVITEACTQVLPVDRRIGHSGEMANATSV